MNAIRTILNKVFRDSYPIVTDFMLSKVTTPAVETTLGSLINNRLKAEKEAKIAAAEAKAVALAKQIAEERPTVVRFLEAVKVSFTHDIKRGTLPIAVLIPADAPFNTGTWNFSKHLHHMGDWNHPHREAFDDFFKWVKAHRLYVGVQRRQGRYAIFCWAAHHDA